jgi:hypothetical protein
MKKTNTKKNSAMKKLLPAFGMLMVSASMLATSTYAWFSMNKEVSVTSMSIAAKSADPIIEISANGTNYYNDLASSGTGSNWTLPATTIGEEPNTTAVKLKLVTPTAIAASGTVSWGWAASTAHNNAQVTNATDAVALTAQSTPAKTESDRAAYLGDGTDLYVLTQKLTIRNVSPDVIANNLKISEVKIDGGSNTIKKATRVLFVSDGKYALYALTSDSTGLQDAALVSAHQWLDANSGASATDMTLSSGIPIVASTLAANGGSADVDVYVFFDGTDATAYTDNATNLSDVSVQFKFAIDD